MEIKVPISHCMEIKVPISFLWYTVWKSKFLSVTLYGNQSSYQLSVYQLEIKVPISNQSSYQLN